MTTKMYILLATEKLYQFIVSGEKFSWISWFREDSLEKKEATPPPV